MNADTLPLKPRVHFPHVLDAGSWGPIRKALKESIKELDGMGDSATAEDLLHFLERYTELYTMVEDKTLLAGASYICNGTVKNALKVAGYALRVTLPALGQRKKAYKILESHPRYADLGPEFSHLKRLVARVTGSKEGLLASAGEYLKVLSYTRALAKARATIDDQQLSLQKAAVRLRDPDRVARERAWRAIHATLLAKDSSFNKLYDGMLASRIKKARKAGFDNARDYYHHKKGRFDYTPDDCHRFHDSIEAVVVPLVRQFNEARRDALGLDALRPWDKGVELPGQPVLKPYASNEDLHERMARAFARVRPAYGETFRRMCASGFVDSENKRGKMPGAMCLPLMDHKAGFVIANGVGLHDDVITLAHEGGHGMHWAAAADIPHAPCKELMLFPMEVAEVGSMAMEFLIYDHLDEFYSDPAHLIAAKRQGLEKAIRFLPWCAIVDAFQQWIYTTPGHGKDERARTFTGLVARFEGATGTDLSGLDAETGVSWFRQSHVFNSPFYYIEYGIAQLAALAIYKNYRDHGPVAIDQYHAFLSLGHSRPLPDLYAAAGIKFDFSRPYLEDIVSFVRGELRALDAVRG